jgi:GT2 family glycosyltransferase
VKELSTASGPDVTNNRTTALYGAGLGYAYSKNVSFRGEYENYGTFGYARHEPGIDRQAEIRRLVGRPGISLSIVQAASVAEGAASDAPDTLGPQPECRMLPQVTAVILTYNRADLLCHAVDSVLEQSYPNCHALIIDDGSTDSTGSLVAQRYGGNPRVEYVYQANGGVSAARNRGISLARGEYIAFLDSDDVWKRWKIELQVACLKRLPGVGMIWTNMDAVDASGTLVKADYLREHYGAYRYFPGYSMFSQAASLAELAPEAADPGESTRVYWGDVYSPMVMGNMCLPSTLLVSREVAQRAGPVDESMKTGEDYDYHLRLSREGGAALVDVSSTLYRIGAADQLSRPAQLLTIAQNTLTTITRAIERDRARITLPSAMIRRKLAAVHGWIASEHLQRRDNASARRHLAWSLRQWPWQARPWLLLAVASANPRLTGSLRAAYRRLRQLPARV